MEKIMRRADFLKKGVNKNGQQYSAWTKEGVKAWILYALHHPEAMAEVHVHTSDKNIKLNALMFSTTAGPATADNLGLGTCGNLPCVGICYAIKTEKFRPSAMVSNMENVLMLRYAFDRAVAEFETSLRKYSARCEKEGADTMVRWHESGEFTPEDSALLDKVSDDFTDARFYGYTKIAEYYVKYYNHPRININWSAWRGMEIPEEVLACGPLKAFFVEFKDGNNEYLEPYRKGARRCPGLINGEFACNKCKFACAKNGVKIAREH